MLVSGREVRDLCEVLLSIARQESHGPTCRKIAEAVTLLACLAVPGCYRRRQLQLL